MKKILFISHSASRSGAPILLLNLAKALHEEYKCETDFIIKQSGELDGEFKKLGSVKIVFQEDNGVYSSSWTKAYLKIIKRKAFDHFFSQIPLKNYDVVVSNTISTFDLLPFIRKNYKGKIVSYIHELTVATDFLIAKEKIEEIKTIANLFLVPGEAVRAFLINAYQVDNNQIKTLPYYIPNSLDNKDKSTNESEFYVGASGSVEYRKGTDFFVQLAYHFSKFYSSLPIKFIWQGGNQKSIEYKFLNEDIRKLGLSRTCFFQTSSSKMEDFYNSIDLFILTSREDPYPLVVLEAANTEIPSICFENSGGAVDFIEGNGKIAKYMDIESMAEAIIYYYSERGKLAQDGKKSKEKLSKLHQDRAKICKQFIDLI